MPSTQSGRKVQITINNPQKHGITHEIIKAILATIKSIIYYCMADEIGLEKGTPHIHLFIVAKTPLRFTTLKKRFPEAHIEFAQGTCTENRAYVEKSDKWAADPKKDTSVPGTFEEWGKMPQEAGQGYRTDIAEVYRQIAEGLSNAEIMSINPSSAKFIGKMDKIRQDILENRYKEQWRDLEVTYIFGPTGTGKTRGVMGTNGYRNVYRVSDYTHPFDRYGQEPVLCLDEFRSSLLIGDMLDYLDGYPLALPARYANRQACYETVYIISNIDLSKQYPTVQRNELATWKAFLRRIHHVVEYYSDGSSIDHGAALDYIFPPKTKEDEDFEEVADYQQFDLL